MINRSGSAESLFKMKSVNFGFVWQKTYSYFSVEFLFKKHS